MSVDDFTTWLSECHIDFIKECVFDDKTLAYNAWVKALAKKAEEMEKWFNNAKWVAIV